MIPRLLFTHRDTHSIVRENLDDDTLVLTDAHNHDLLKNYTTELIQDCCVETVHRIRTRTWQKVIAVGGCTVLDVGRLASAKEVICVPTILSTSCISVNRSVVKQSNRIQSKESATPSNVIISVPDVLQTPAQWWQSGFGDLFANISASIDIQFKAENLEYEAVRKNVPQSFDALNWVVEEFQGFDEGCVYKLANYLHNSSLDVIERGDTKLSAGGEHELCYKIIAQHPEYTTSKPTHGQIVAIGTLIACKAYSKETQSPLYNILKQAYRILSLPVNDEDLHRIGIEKEHLIAGLESTVNSPSYLGQFLAKQENVSSIELL